MERACARTCQRRGTASSVPDFNDDNFIGFSLVDECSSKSANANAAMIDSIADDDGQDHASSQNSGMRSEAHQHYLQVTGLDVILASRSQGNEHSGIWIPWNHALRFAPYGSRGNIASDHED